VSFSANAANFVIKSATIPKIWDFFLQDCFAGAHCVLGRMANTPSFVLCHGA